MAEEDFSGDKGFRRYAANVDRALSIFDTQLQEWADYISFLGRLSKALQSHPANISVVPSKSLVARRLAQCLAPSLPSGVHQKALEVYNYIFTLITPAGVARDLSLYLPGLSPVLSFASLTVRSPFLILLRQHILSLPAPTLRPACKAIILTLLPGLEDEGSEDFDTTYKLINDFRNALRAGAELEDSYFWQCFFLATINSPSRRLGSLAYLVRELPKLGSGTTSTNDVPPEAAIASSKMLTTPEPGLLVRCFAAGLRDEQILIQRGFLDLLVTHLPLHASVFTSMITQPDLELLMRAASSVVARRDMSLNRRLWSWLLGPEPLPSADDRPNSSGTDKGITAARTEYFEKHGLKPLTNSILALINADPRDVAERARPFRICLSLMDRWEIGGLVVPLVFLPAIRSVKRYQVEEGVEKKEFQEVLRSASVFFNGVESGLIWSEINSLIFAALEDDTTAPIGAEHQISRKMASLELVRFIINHFNISEEEMLAVHIPLTSLGIICTVNTLAGTEEEDDEDDPKEQSPIPAAAISLALELIDHIPAAVLAPRSGSQRRGAAEPGEKGALDDGSVVIRLKAFYTQHQGDLTLSPPPVSSSDAAELFLQKATRIFSHSLSATFTGYGEGEYFHYSQEQQSWVAKNAQLLILLLEKTSSTPTTTTSSPPASKALATEINSLFDVLQSRLPWGKIMLNQRLPFSAASAMNDVVVALYPRYIYYEQLYALTPLLVQQFWERLDPRDVRYHVEAVRCIWKLHYALCNNAADGGDQDVEGCISSLMQQADSQNQDGTDTVGLFAILWLHSLGEDKDKSVFLPLLKQPLFLVLDLLSTSNSNGIHKWAEPGQAKAFLQSLNGESLAQVFNVMVSETAHFPRFQDGFVGDWAENGRAVSTYDREGVDCSQPLYILQTLGRILANSTQEMWHELATAVVQYKSKERGVMSDGPGGDGRPATMQRYFARICLRGMGGVGIGRGDATMRDSILPLNKAALKLLGKLWGEENAYRNDKDMRDIYGEAAKLLCWWADRLNQNASGRNKALQSEILEVLGKTVRILAAFNGSPFEAMTGQMDVKLHNKHLQEERRRTLRSPLGEPLTPPPTLLCSLQTTIIGALHQIPSQAVMSDWAVFVRECVRLTIFNVDQLEPLARSSTEGLSRGNASLNVTFQERYLEPETDQHTYIETEKSMCARIDILETLILKAHDLVHAEDILMLESKGRKSSTNREDRGSDKGFLGGIFGSTGEAGNEVAEKDTPITPRQRVQVLITGAAETMFYAWHWADRGKKGIEADSKHSFHYTSLKLRSRARKLLEVLFQREAGACMETMVGLWTSDNKDTEQAALQLINVLDRTQPQNAMPLLFELVHDRVMGPQHPTFGWRMTQSAHGDKTLTSTADVLAFMNSYTLSLENDAVVEIWGDAAAFLRDILANPMTYRAILPSLVKFLGLVGEKIAKTMRGKSDKVMRREVADMWLRLLTAVFTTNPGAWQTIFSSRTSAHPRHQAQDIISVLACITPSLPQILSENTLILQAANTLSSSIIQPTIRAKQFPENITPTFLHLLHSLGQFGAGQQNSASAGLMKVFRRDVGEAFNHPAFFSCTSSEFDSWKGILRLWSNKDRERIVTDLLSRIAPPTTAGIVFGVGATSARMEADVRTKSTLKRIMALILADGRDAWVAILPAVFAKVTELLTATTTSSPSSATRAEIYILIRSLIIRTSPIHLSFLWPSLNSELESCLSSCLPGGNSREAEREREVWDGAALVQGCKLLEQLLDIAPEEWQVGDWTFVRDGADFRSPPSEEDAVALTDRLVVELGNGGDAPAGEHVDLSFETEGMEREDVILRLRPFFAGLAGRQMDEVLGGTGGSKIDELRMWKGVVRDVFVKDETDVARE